MRSLAFHKHSRCTVVALALAMAFAVLANSPVHAAQAMSLGSSSAAASSMRGGAHSGEFRISMRIVSSCKVFVSTQGEVRSACAYVRTPPPQILAITSMQNSPVSDQVREYSVTF